MNPWRCEICGKYAPANYTGGKTLCWEHLSDDLLKILGGKIDSGDPDTYPLWLTFMALYHAKEYEEDSQLQHSPSIPNSKLTKKNGDIRPEIKEFARIMEEEMRYHDEYKGDSWKEMNIGSIEERIEDEFKEFQIAESASTGADELVDIANFCMMGWNLLTNRVGNHTQCPPQPIPKPPRRPK